MKYKFNKNKRFGWRYRIVAGLLVLALAGGILASTFIKPPKASAAITYLSSSTATVATAAASITMNTPTGIAAGNLLIAQVIALPGTGNAVTITPPTGWTSIGTSPTSSKYLMSLYYHVVAAGDPTSVSWSFSPTATATGGISAYAGVDTKNPIDNVSSPQTNGSNTQHTAPSVTSSFANGFVIPFWGFEAATSAATIDPSLKAIYNTNNGFNSGVANGYVQLTNAGATGTYTATTSAATASLALTVALQPAAAAAGVQFVASSTPSMCSTGCSTAQTEASPTGWKTGDLLITTLVWQGTVTVTAPTGWTQIDSTQTGVTGYVSANYYHYANTSTDPGSWTWNFSAAPTSVIVATAEFQGVDQTNPIDVSGTNFDAAISSTHTSPTITTTIAQDMLYSSYGANGPVSVGTNFPTTSTSIWDTSASTSNGVVSLFADYELKGVAGTAGNATVTSSKKVNDMMYSIAIRPALPAPQLLSPANGAHLKLTPTFQMVSATLVGPLQYVIQICSAANCPAGTIQTTYDERTSQTGWTGQDSGGTAYVASTNVSGSTTATYTAQTPLTECTTYYWRAAGYDTQISQLYNYSTTRTFNTSCRPSAPTLIFPANGQTGVRMQPELQLASTDLDGDYVQYHMQICQDSACVTVLNDLYQSTSQSGWAGQDAQNGTAYTDDPSSIAKSVKAYYTPLAPLVGGRTYYWRAWAIDPAGTNTYGPVSTIQSFTINTSETRILNGRIESGKIL